ncbi:hypothetical protein AC1031_005086 [Aphanomyces cochlioides]|nr:hypothetical protein AC1031_005086 [Aphanomyces cochlioides]
MFVSYAPRDPSAHYTLSPLSSFCSFGNSHASHSVYLLDFIMAALKFAGLSGACDKYGDQDEDCLAVLFIDDIVTDLIVDSSGDCQLSESLFLLATRFHDENGSAIVWLASTSPKL